MTDPGRRWLEVRARAAAPSDQADLLADGLVALGARGVEVRGAWYVSYFDEPDDPGAFLEELVRGLTASTGLTSIRVEHGWQAHEAWEETWKRGLGPRRVTDRIVVHPSWAPPVDRRDTDLVIELDPGMAFGTAEHGTTRGCLRLLDGLVEPGDHLLDVGAGSGILSIAAALLGAARVVAVEGDRYACEAMRENVERNGVSALVGVVEAWATPESLRAAGPMRGVIANIESGLLRPLFDGLRSAIAPGGWLLVSGILEEEWSGVRETLEAAGFAFRQVDEDGPWRSGLFDRDPS